MRWLIIVLLLQASSLDVPASLPRVSMEDVCLSHVIVREAQAEGLHGMKAVLDSVRYRMTRRNKTACQVVTEKAQFASIRSGEKLKYDEKLLLILAKVRTLPVMVVAADHFHSGKPPYWAEDFKFIGKVGSHYFYRS